MRTFPRSLIEAGRGYLPGAEGEGSAYRPWFLAGLVVVLAWVVWLLHPLGPGTRRVIGVEDTYLHTWNLWWVYRALAVEQVNPYLTRFGGYPGGVRLTYHSLILPLGLASIPLFAAGMPAFQVYLVWLYLVPLLGYLGMFLLLQRMRAPPMACTAAGLFWVLRPSFWRHLPRPDRFCYVLIPFVILALLFARDRSPPWLVLPAVLGAAIVLMSPYYGMGLLLLWLLGFWIRPRLDLRFGRYALLGPLILLLSSFEWLPRLLGSVPAYRTSFGFFAPPKWFFVPPGRLAWVSAVESLTDLTLSTGRGGYLGMAGVAVVVVVIWKHWGSTVRWGLAAVVCFWFFMISPPHLVRFFRFLSETAGVAGGGQLQDLFRIFRSPQRLMVFPVLLMALAVGFFPGWKRRWGVVLLLLVVVEQVPTPVDRKMHKLAPVEAFKPVRTAVQAPALVQFPFERKGGEPAYAQTVHRRKFALSPMTYVPKRLERFLESNPVLRALYHRRPPPDRGWKALREMGYGGFILHFWPRAREGHQPLRSGVVSRWRTLLPVWRETLRRRFGPPPVANRHYELYRFDRPAEAASSG